MKFLLIVPPKYFHKFWDIKHFTFPLGIWSIASGLGGRSNTTVEILDCIAEAPNEIQDVDSKIAKMGMKDANIIGKINNSNPDIIGIQCISSNQHEALIYYAKLIRKYFPKTVIIAGGAHVSALPYQVLSDANGAIDFIIIGEGEETVTELLDCFDKQDRVSQIKGLGIWDNGSILINEKRGIINDLNYMPLLNPIYFKNIHYPVNPPHSFYTSGRKWIEIMFSRGCIYDCAWCHSPAMWGRTVRKLNINKIYQQLDILKRAGYNELLVEDDDLFLDKNWGRGVIKAIRQTGFHWQVAGGLRLESLDHEIIDSIVASNCTAIFCPININREIEACDSRILLKNNYSEKFKRFKEHKIYIFSSIILGVPNQTIKEMQYQIDYAHNLVSNGWIDYCVVFAFSPLPGTRWWEEVVRGNKYKLHDGALKWHELSNHVPCNIDTPYWKYSELENVVLKAHELINGKDKTQMWFSQKEWVRE